MPRNVRNFWIELDVEGSAKKIGTGPRSKDGGFAARILMREKGSISPKAVRIQGHVTVSGALQLTVDVDGSAKPAVVILTDR